MLSCLQEEDRRVQDVSERLARAQVQVAAEQLTSRAPAAVNAMSFY
jgi:hypothetical protein